MMMMTLVVTIIQTCPLMQRQSWVNLIDLLLGLKVGLDNSSLNVRLVMP
jgi:hypothetical protein